MGSALMYFPRRAWRVLIEMVRSTAFWMVDSAIWPPALSSTTMRMGVEFFVEVDGSQMPMLVGCESGGLVG